MRLKEWKVSLSLSNLVPVFLMLWWIMAGKWESVVVSVEEVGVCIYGILCMSLEFQGVWVRVRDCNWL